MTITRANEIFRAKNTTGCIYPHPTISGRYCVVFTEYGKVYDYCAESYASLLNRLGFRVVTESGLSNFRNEIAELARKIKEGRSESVFSKSGYIEYTEEQKEEMRRRIAEIEAFIAEATVA